MATIYPRKKEMLAKYLRPAPAGAAFRFKTDSNGSFLQLKDAASAQFRPVWLKNGVLQSGAAES